MSNYDIVRDACVRANPSIREHENRCMTCGYGFAYCKCSPKNTEWYRDRNVHLADVLLTVKARVCKRCNGAGGYVVGAEMGYSSCGDCDGNIYFIEDASLEDIVHAWDLRNDSLDRQKPEVIDWLAELLTQKQP